MKDGGKKLDQLAVDEMREAYQDGESQGSLARRFGVSVGTVGRIVRGESWQGAAAAPARRGRAFTPPARDFVVPEMPPPEYFMKKAGAPPPSLLEGGDAPDETGGQGLSKLSTLRPEE